MKLTHDNKDENKIEIKRMTKNPGNHLTPFLPAILLNPSGKPQYPLTLLNILFSGSVCLYLLYLRGFVFFQLGLF